MSNAIKSLLALGIAATVAMLVPESELLDPAARRAVFILVFAALLWMTDAMPAYSVGILIIGLKLLLLGKAGGVYATTTRDWEEFVAVLGHPLVWLFFGGFVLAAGMAATGIDRWLANRILKRFGGSTGQLLIGLMLTTFGLSMIMSNTATTAMMLAILAPLLLNKKGSATAKALVLGIAVAANLGGMGSLIGTPPNAIAVGSLMEVTDGPQIGFLDWIILGLPPALLLLGLAFMMIRLSYKLDDEPLVMPEQKIRNVVIPRWQSVTVVMTLITTVALWLTSEWHRAPTAVISFIPIVMFTTTGILTTQLIRGLPYDVLFMLAGGLALGQTVSDTGLSLWIANLLPVGDLSQVLVILFFAYLTVLLSNFMSNTAAATVLIPISITVAEAFPGAIAVTVALAASAAMLLPVATPPNAMAFATGHLQSRDFLRLGVIIGLVAPPVFIAWLGIVLVFL
ncbi:MAG: SLC13 family permease [Gammaproteobacteria bacterium]